MKNSAQKSSVDSKSDAASALKLKQLKCFPVVHERVATGWPIPEIARYIQEDCKEYPDTERDSVVRALYRYKKTLAPTELLPKQTVQNSRAIKKAFDQLSNGLNELHELEELYAIQRDRIEIDLKAEKSIGKLFSTTGNEVRIAQDILNSSAALKAKLGLTPNKIGQVDVEHHAVKEAIVRYGTPGVAKVLENPEKRRRVVSIAERVITLIGGEENSDLVQQLLADSDGGSGTFEPLPVEGSLVSDEGLSPEDEDEQLRLQGEAALLEEAALEGTEG